MIAVASVVNLLRQAAAPFVCFWCCVFKRINWTNKTEISACRIEDMGRVELAVRLRSRKRHSFVAPPLPNWLMMALPKHQVMRNSVTNAVMSHSTVLKCLRWVSAVSAFSAIKRLPDDLELSETEPDQLLPLSEIAKDYNIEIDCSSETIPNT